jgi:hypothetical protein
MKNSLYFTLLIFLSSCGMKVPYTEEIKNKYDLDEVGLKKVQFYTSSTIIMVRSNKQEKQGLTDGKLVTNENKVENRIIIPPNTKCVFEGFDSQGEILLRFEQGPNKVLRFATRKNQQSGRYYLLAKWDPNKGGEIDYGNLTYYASQESGAAYLLVITKKLNKTKRKDRVVKGMKV